MKTSLHLLSNAEKDLAWFYDHFPEIEKEYANKIIAIYHGKIIASALNIEILLSKLREIKVDQKEVLIEKVIPRNEIIIL